MITEITEISVITETTTEVITEVTTTEEIMTEMIEMTDNITEEEGEEEMTMIMTMIEKTAENTEITSVEIEETEMIERGLTNLSSMIMMIIRKIISKKKR